MSVKGRFTPTTKKEGLEKLHPDRRKFLKTATAAAAASALGVGIGAEGLVTNEVESQIITIQNGQMKVVLDSKFPRVFEYHIRGRKLFGAEAGEPTIELNGQRYGRADFTVQTQAGDSTASYTITLSRLKLTILFEFMLEDTDMIFRLRSVDEQGDFRLETLYFPNHCLVRVDIGQAGATMHRSIGKYVPWNLDPNRRQPTPAGGYFGLGSEACVESLSKAKGEPDPLKVNYACAYSSSICGTLRNNIYHNRVCTQILGEGPATGYGLWNSVYHYRLRGKVRPLLESRIGIITEDQNGDEEISWMEAALWHRKLIPPMADVYRDAFVTFMTCAFGDYDKGRKGFATKVYTTYDESLDWIRRIYNITGGAKQVTYLVGWQQGPYFRGFINLVAPEMDKPGVPTMTALGGHEKFLRLLGEASKYNCLVSYHCNLDEAYEDAPGFDPNVVCLGSDGKPYLWVQYWTGGPATYHISHTKEMETGYFEKRANALLKWVPVHGTIQFDTFRYSNKSFALGDEIGYEEEMAACEAIVHWFRARGIEVSIEAATDAFLGLISYYWHWVPGAWDPFFVIMSHGKAWGGNGRLNTPVEKVLGFWPADVRHSIRTRPLDLGSVGEAEVPASTLNEICEVYYLGVLLFHYLAKKELVYLGPDGKDYVARFADRCVSRWDEDRGLTITDAGLTIAQDKDRFVPVSDSEIRLYSALGGGRTWTLPKAWLGKKLELITLTADGPTPGPKFSITDGQITLTMEAGQPYALRET